MGFNSAFKGLKPSVITLILLTWRTGWTPNNASRWEMGYNSVCKGLMCPWGWRLIVETCRRVRVCGWFVILYRSFATTALQLKIGDFFKINFYRFWSALLFYECNDDTTALQRRVLQTALWHYTCYKCMCKTFLSIPITQKMPNFELWHSCRK